MTYKALARHRPAHRWTDGDIACRVGEDLGLPPDPEQKWILDAMFAERAPGIPSAFEVAAIGPRQNFKSAVLEVGALTDVYVFQVPLHVWTAHLLSTAQKSFQDMRNRIVAHPDYDARTRFYEGHQDLAIIVEHDDAPDSLLEFHARTAKKGRGFSCDKLTLDEALFLRPGDMGALLPTMLTRPHAQVRYGSSAGVLSSKVLRGIRDRGRGGKDPKLAYAEYGARRKKCASRECTHIYGVAVGCALDDRELWWESNLALWVGRITEDGVENLRSSMEPDEFMREVLVWWEDPVSEGGALSVKLWNDQADPGAERGKHVVFGTDVNEDREAYIAVAWWRDDGRAQVMLANKGAPLPAFELAKKCSRIQDRWGGTVFTTKQSAKALESKDVRTEMIAASDFGTACDSFVNQFESGKLRHGNQERLNAAIKAAKWPSGGPARGFLLQGFPEVGPLAAAARAVHGLINNDVDVWGFFE